MPEADRPPRLTRVQRARGGWVVVYLQSGGRWPSGGCTEGGTDYAAPLGHARARACVPAYLPPRTRLPLSPRSLPNGLRAPSLLVCYGVCYGLCCAVADIHLPTPHHHHTTTTPLPRYPDLRTSLVCVPPGRVVVVVRHPPTPPPPSPRTRERPKSGRCTLTHFRDVRFGKGGSD